MEIIALQIQCSIMDNFSTFSACSQTGEEIQNVSKAQIVTGNLAFGIKYTPLFFPTGIFILLLVEGRVAGMF